MGHNGGPHLDGIWDIMGGLIFVALGLLIASDMGFLMGVLPVTAIPVTLAIRKAVTAPRLGYAKFSPLRELKEKKNIAALSILLTVIAILGLVVFMAYTGRAEWQNWVRSLGAVPFGAVVSIVLGVAGLLFGLKRFLAYAVLILATFIAAHLLSLRLPVCFILPGAVFFVVGLIMLILFLRKFPKPPKEAAHAEV
jgi:hypothetical protein